MAAFCALARVRKTRVLRRRWLLLLLVVLLCSGCLVDRKQRGTEIDPQRLAWLYPGVSTKNDVLRILGVPSRKSVMQDHEAWVYDYSLEETWVLFLGLYNEKRRTIQQRGVALLFADERLHDYLFVD
jgi:outer membrane protein assembly factor BamE (lipoprotein component of BamABCDE complex)